MSEDERKRKRKRRNKQRLELEDIKPVRKRFNPLPLMRRRIGGGRRLGSSVLQHNFRYKPEPQPKPPKEKLESHKGKFGWSEPEQRKPEKVIIKTELNAEKLLRRFDEEFEEIRNILKERDSETRKLVEWYMEQSKVDTEALLSELEKDPDNETLKELTLENMLKDSEKMEREQLEFFEPLGEGRTWLTRAEQRAIEKAPARVIEKVDDELYEIVETERLKTEEAGIPETEASFAEVEPEEFLRDLEETFPDRDLQVKQTLDLENPVESMETEELIPKEVPIEPEPIDSLLEAIEPLESELFPEVNPSKAIETRPEAEEEAEAG